MSVAIARLRQPRRGNEVIDQQMSAAERSAMLAAAAGKIEELFEILQVDYRNDHNTKDTPRRVAKMFVEEILAGRYGEPPSITEFDNAEGFDELIVTGPIELRSTCAHHLMPIYGEAYIGIIPAPDGRIIGLSKYDRIVDHFAARLQIQEELVKQIGQFIMERTAPRGLAVRISAVHMCKTQRGVRATHRSRMVTTTFFGDMRENQRLKDEFQRECLHLERNV